MTTISRSTIVNTLPLFIRDVLRNELTDSQSPARSGSAWIFKGMVEEEYNPPVVSIGETRTNERTMNVQKSKRFPVEATMLIQVYTNKMKDRDDLVNETREKLHDYDSTDGTNSIKSQQLTIQSFNCRNFSVPTSDPVKIRRIGTITIMWVYSGS